MHVYVCARLCVKKKCFKAYIFILCFKDVSAIPAGMNQAIALVSRGTTWCSVTLVRQVFPVCCAGVSLGGRMNNIIILYYYCTLLCSPMALYRGFKGINRIMIKIFK